MPYPFSVDYNHVLAPLILILFTGEMLIKSKTKVVVVASDAHKLGDLTPELLDGDDMPDFFNVPKSKNMHNQWKQYGYSNRARILFAKELCARHPEITAVSVHPGVVKTEIGRNMPLFMKCISMPFSCLLKSPEQGAATSVHCATENMSKNRGDYFVDSKVSDLKEEWVKPEVQKKLWDVTEKFCNDAKL